MKASRVFLVILITAAAFTAAVNIFSDNKAQVEVKRVTQMEYADSIMLSGTIYENAGYTSTQDGSTQALAQTRYCVTAYVGENNISKISLGQSAVVSGSGFKDRSYDATVIKIGDTAKKITVGGVKIAAVEVTLAINSPDNALKSGFSANARIYTEEKSDVIVIPYSSLVVRDGRQYVYLCSGDAASLTPIKTGRELIDGYEVLSGVKSSDRVVINPQLVKGETCAVTVVSEVQ